MYLQRHLLAGVQAAAGVWLPERNHHAGSKAERGVLPGSEGSARPRNQANVNSGLSEAKAHASVASIHFLLATHSLPAPSPHLSLIPSTCLSSVHTPTHLHSTYASTALQSVHIPSVLRVLPPSHAHLPTARPCTLPLTHPPTPHVPIQPPPIHPSLTHPATHV